MNRIRFLPANTTNYLLIEAPLYPLFKEVFLNGLYRTYKPPPPLSCVKSPDLRGPQGSFIKSVDPPNFMLLLKALFDVRQFII